MIQILNCKIMFHNCTNDFSETDFGIFYVRIFLTHIRSVMLWMIRINKCNKITTKPLEDRFVSFSGNCILIQSICTYFLIHLRILKKNNKYIKAVKKILWYHKKNVFCRVLILRLHDSNFSTLSDNSNTIVL